MEFALNDRVCSNCYRHDKRGKVVGFSKKKDKVYVLWDGNLKKSLVEVYDLELFSFEKEWDEIADKLKTAAIAMQQANELAHQHELSIQNCYLGDVRVNIDKLFNELDTAGWRTSSLNC